MSRLVVFDVDGTFLDSHSVFDIVLREYSQANGLPEPCVKTVRLGYGDPHAHDFGWGVSKEEQYKHLFGAFILNDSISISGDPKYTPQLYAGAAEGLKMLKNMGHTLAIITSKPEEPLLHLLDKYGIRDLFSAHRNYDDITRRREKEKPEPDMLHSVMRELKFAPQNTVMVGDTTMDIRMGRSAGTHTIGVTWGAHPVEHLMDAGAHHIVDTHFDDVTHTVKKIFS